MTIIRRLRALIASLYTPCADCVALKAECDGCWEGRQW